VVQNKINVFVVLAVYIIVKLQKNKLKQKIIISFFKTIPPDYGLRTKI